MKIMCFCFFTLLLFSVNASADSHLTGLNNSSIKIPYEKCNYENEGFTKQLIENSSPTPPTEADDCTTCSNQTNNETQDAVTKAIIKAVIAVTNKANTIPDICFYASSLRSLNKKGSKSEKEYYYCKSPLDASNKDLMSVFDPTTNKPDKIWPRRACLSKDYTDLTAKSFNKMAECFGYKTLEEKKKLFVLFNHESSFILNNRSESDAKCYGQLTGPTVNQIDKYLYFNIKVPDPWIPYRGIYEQALESCPDLKNEIIIPPLIKTGGNMDHDSLADLQEKTNPVCRTSQHAPTCFFYSMYNFKINETAFKIEIEKVTNRIPTKDDKGEDKTKEQLAQIKQIEKNFELPIKLTEVLHVTGTFTNTAGKEIKTDWIFKDNLELYDTIKNLKYDMSNVKVEKVPMYDKALLKKTFTQTAYNGGKTIITHHFERFLRRRKKEVAKGCSDDDLEKSRCKQRAQLKTNKPISFKDFISDLSKYLEVEYLKKSKKIKPARRKEVANFYKNLLKHNEYLKNQGNFLKSDLKKLKTESKLPDEDIEAFINNVSTQCSSVLEEDLLKKNGN